MRNLYEGEKIRLTARYEGDAAAMARWYEDSDFARRLDTDIAFPRTAQELEEEEMAGAFTFIIRPMGGDEPLGFVALHSLEWNNGAAALSIGIGAAGQRGKGYGGEALALALQYAFCELNLHRVGLDYIDDNERAMALYQRAGFVEEGRLREYVHRDGRRRDRVYMGILRGEWECNNK